VAGPPPPSGLPPMGAPMPVAVGSPAMAPTPIRGRVLPLRPLTVADVLDGSVRAVRRVVGPTVALVLVVLGPLQLLTNLAISRIAPGLVGGGLGGLFDPESFLATELAAGPLVLVNLLAGLLGYLLSLIASAGVVALLLALDRGEPVSLGSALRDAVRVLVAVLVASFLLSGLAASVLGVLLVASIVVLVLPVIGPLVFVLVVLPVVVAGIALTVALTSVVVPVAVVERGGPIQTLTRAVTIVVRRPVAIAWITLLMAIVVGILAVAVQLPALLLSGVLPVGGWAVEALGTTAGQLISVPLSAAAALLVYLDVRVRTEGLDLEVRVRELAAG
jgi:hypothetical protein